MIKIVYQISLLLIILLFQGITSFAQKGFEKTYSFEYSPIGIETGQGFQQFGWSSNQGYWDQTYGAPIIVISEPIGTNGFEMKVEITGVEAITDSDMNYLHNQDAISKDILFEKSVSKQGPVHFANIELVGLVRSNTNEIVRITEVKIKFDPLSKPMTMSRAFASNSVLSSGNGEWYKIGLTKTGLYKIDYKFLQDLGVDMQNLSSNYLNVFGNGMPMLSEDNSEPRIDDLMPRDIQVFDGGDGVFDVGDYIIFYAKGPDEIKLNGDKFTFEKNNFTDSSYYFISVNPDGIPHRVGSGVLSSSPKNNTVTKFNYFEYFEEDEVNLAKSGMEWLGDLFDVQLSKSYGFNLTGLSTADSIEIGVNVGVSSPVSGMSDPTKFVASSNGVTMNVDPTGSGQGSVSPKVRFAYNSMKVKSSSENVNVNLSFQKNGYPSAKGYLDYIELNCKKNLRMEGSQMFFSSLQSVGPNNVSEFLLTNAHDVVYIWEVTDQYQPKLVPFNLQNSTLSFTVDTEELKSFIASKNSQYLIPASCGKVENQNLHGLNNRDMVIITAPVFLPAAQRLATFHESEGLTVHVVLQEEIFNEFSSGMRDPVAIRHFLKMFYDRANGNASEQTKFCLIMGDCSYDYRNRLNSNSDFVITYESKESMSTATYSTDDFYVILDDSEVMRGTDLMDVGVGRLPVQTLSEAEGMVDKIIAYSTRNVTSEDCNCEGGAGSVLGDWRNVVTMVSDDGDGDAYFDDVEDMYEILSLSHNDLNIQKIHSDAYQESVTPGGERNLDASEAIRSRVQRGALLVNYIGHGGELGWAHEAILNVPTIQNWSNGTALPVFMTATCEFSRYDDHDRVSAGEYVVLNPEGGGIALFTTTRLVYTTSNRQLARVFYDTVADKVNGKPQYIGDIYKGAKNKFAIKHGSTEARKFTFLGDPAIRYALPEHNVILDSINGISINVFNDTLKALSKVEVSGHIEDDNADLISNFEGLVYPTIYDKISELSTLGNSSGSTQNNFEMWKNVIYKGKASVKDGYFNFTFIIPQDITYTYGNGRFSFYAENGEEDGNGVSESALIGGVNTNAPSDDIGPTVELFLNNENFVDGGITDASPVFMANVYDDNGINMVGNGIGHNIEIRLDNNSEPIILNDYYESDVDSYKSGAVRFQLSDLSVGNHTVHFKVWDVYNNSSDSELNFTVVEEEEIAVDHLLNYPNPFTTHTEFSFEHNQICDYLDIEIQIFTISGRVVKTIQQRVTTDGYRIGGIVWDGRDEYGDKIGIGTYVYKLTLQNERGDKIDQYEKLFLLN